MWQVEVTTATAASLEMLALHQRRKSPNRHAHVATGTHLIPYDSDTLLASSGEAIVVNQHG